MIKGLTIVSEGLPAVSESSSVEICLFLWVFYIMTREECAIANILGSTIILVSDNSIAWLTGLTLAQLQVADKDQLAQVC